VPLQRLSSHQWSDYPVAHTRMGPETIITGTIVLVTIPTNTNLISIGRTDTIPSVGGKPDMTGTPNAMSLTKCVGKYVHEKDHPSLDGIGVVRMHGLSDQHGLRSSPGGGLSSGTRVCSAATARSGLSSGSGLRAAPGLCASISIPLQALLLLLITDQKFALTPC
jgi:hypothetical protein